jgi:hypothetical protein
MRRTGVIAVVVLALAPAGCGSDEEVRTVRAWPGEPPYLPPPDPGALRAQAAAAGERAAAPAGGVPTARERAATPAAATDDGPPSDAEVARDLREAYGLDDDASAADLVDAATLTADGEATVPPGAPARVARIIRGANEVARKPYVYGGGHGRLADETWIDTAYDCSGSISFALATAGLIDTPMASGALAGWGRAGPGKWVTIYANDGHAFMTVAGLRFDTSGRRQTGTRWQTAGRGTGGFTVRHPPGL